VCVTLDSARREAPVPAVARWLLGQGIAATLAANVVRRNFSPTAGHSVMPGSLTIHIGKISDWH